MKLGNGWTIGCLVAALFLTLGLAVGTASAQNVLLNPGFEDGDLTGWVVAGGNQSATVSVVADNGPTEMGTNAAFLDNQGEALGLTLKQTTAVGSVGAGTVFYSFDLKLGEAAVGGVFFVEIFAEQSGVGIVGGSGLLGNYAPADWTNFQGQFDAPAGTDFLTIQFTAVTGAAVGTKSTMYVDNANLNQGGSVANSEISVGTLKAMRR